MSESLIVIVVLSYFSLLFVVSSLTKGNSDNKTFFSGNKESPWYIVAFGMVGAPYLVLHSFQYQVMLGQQV